MAPIIGGSGGSSSPSFWSRFKQKFRSDKRKPVVNISALDVDSSSNCAGRPASVYCPPSSSSKLLETFISDQQNDIPSGSKFEITRLQNVNNSLPDPEPANVNWTKTVPLRRHPHGKKRPTSRPVSLEIRGSPEHSSPLGTYLSTSCNFRTPDEVVLRKSKTRVKTPRHPPLPRLSLNSEPTL